jgi:hypothetical protein
MSKYEFIKQTKAVNFKNYILHNNVCVFVFWTIRFFKINKKTNKCVNHSKYW